MTTSRVKVFEEGTKKSLPIWAWLLPLLLLLALLAFFLLHRHPADNTAVTTTQSAGTAVPQLGTVHFDTDKATLTPEGQATLNRAADYMKSNPGIHLRLEGYTDATGSSPHNDALSQQRAATVEQFLEAKGIPKDRLTGNGFGPQQPVADNATEAGKADNRRVELFQQP